MSDVNDLDKPVNNIFLGNGDDDFSDELMNMLANNNDTDTNDDGVIDDVETKELFENDDYQDETDGENNNIDEAFDVEEELVVPTSKSDVTPVVDTETLTPLQQLKKQKAENSGIVIDNDALEKGKDGPKVDFSMNDTRVENIKVAFTELDKSIANRKKVIITNKPTNENEYTELVRDIDNLRVKPDGTLYFGYLEEFDFDPSAETEEEYRKRLANRKIIEYTPRFCRARTKDDPPYEEGEQVKTVSENTTKEESKETTSESESNNDKVSDEVKKTVQVIIDKTGLGAEIHFTDEEKAKLEVAETINVTEVVDEDISVLLAKSTDGSVSLQDRLDTYDFSDVRTTICFPASGFRAQMKGLSYGEYSDIALGMENITVDTYRKRLSVIYNKMTNVSCGKFNSFEEFLKEFAFSDINMALYGLYVSTQKEKETIDLRCRNESCNKGFTVNFSPRALIKLERCAPVFLEKYKELVTAPASEFDAIHASSMVMKPKYVKLPKTKIIVEVGIASAYDFLYNFVPLMNPDTYKEVLGDDITDTYASNILLLTSVRSVHVPDGNGGYIHCNGYKDILDTLYKLPVEEIKVIMEYATDAQSKYTSTFSIGEVVCPHCGTVTKDLVVEMDDMVFQTFSRLMNTDIKLTTLQTSPTA